MKSIAEILKSKGITEATKFHNYEYLYEMVKVCCEEYSGQFHKPDVNGELPSDYEPYFGWCDVDGCENEGCSGGMAWRDTGYWTVCSKHSQMNREGKEQPKMKQTAIDKEKTRKPDGTLP